MDAAWGGPGTQMLDYFAQLRTSLRDDHVIFRFEDTMECAAGSGTERLVHQLCLAAGFDRRATDAAPRDDKPDYTLGEYLTGKGS